MVWIGLDWIGLDWIGLDWIGLDWIGLIDRVIDLSVYLRLVLHVCVCFYIHCPLFIGCSVFC